MRIKILNVYKMLKTILVRDSTTYLLYLKKKSLDSSGGSEVKQQHTSAEAADWIPGLGRIHASQANEAHEPQPLSPRSRACAPQREKPPNEKPELHNKEEPQLSIRESLCTAMKTQQSHK